MNTTIQNTTKYKNSPLGLIPEDWDIKTLGEVTDYIKGFAFSSSDYTTEGIRIIRISDTTSTSIKDEGAIYMNIDDAPKYKKWELQLNDLVFTTVGSRPPMYDSMVGKVIKIEDKYKGSFLNQNAVIIRAKENTNQEFIYSQFKVKRYLDFIETIVRGNANQVSITLDNLFKYQLLFPSSEEQKAIADCLSSWDKAIEKQNALITQKELSKKALMQQLLSGKKRLKGYSRAWKEYHLKDMFSERNETGYLDLTLLSVGANGIYPQSEAVKKDSSNEDKSKYKRICINDIGYNTMRMWQGRSALSSLEGIVSPAYTVLKPRENTYSLYFSYLFKTPKLMNLFWRNSQGLVDDTLNCKYKDFARIKYILPEIDEQTAIANVLQCADGELQLLKKKLEQLKEQKKGMMQVLLTGKKRLKY